MPLLTILGTDLQILSSWAFIIVIIIIIIIIIIIVIFIIIIIISSMLGICTYIPETNYIRREYFVAPILL